MRLFVFALLLWAQPLLAADPVAALRYPEDFFAVHGKAEPDLRVELQGDAEGVVLQARVLSSTRPERDPEVVKALRGWRFRPGWEQGKPVAWTRELGFVFGPLEPVDTPARLPGDTQLMYPEGKGWSGTDAEVLIEAAVTAAGEIRSLRILEASDPDFARIAAQEIMLGRRCEPAMRNGRAVASLQRLPLLFTTMPVVVKQVKPTYPIELRKSGNQGDVQVAFTITAEGEVRDVRIVESAHPTLERAVVEAVGQWRYQPMTRRGQAVAGKVVVVVPFSLRNHPGSLLQEPAVKPYAVGGALKFPEGLPEEFRYDQPPQVRVAQAVVYPFDLLVEGVTGSAMVNLVVRPDGKVHEGHILKATRPEFGLAARAAMEAWEFTPARKDGKPTWALISRETRFDRSGREALGESAQRLLRILKKGQSAIPGLADLDTLPAAIYQPVPRRPAGSRGADAMGRVMVEFIIDRDGRAQLPRVLDAPDESLAWAAATAVSRWQFAPPLRGGKPVDVRATVPVDFHPPEAKEP